MSEEESSVLSLIVSMVVLVSWGFSILFYNKYPLLEPFLFMSLPFIASTYLTYSYVKENMYPDRKEIVKSSNKVCKKSRIGLLKKLFTHKNSLRECLMIAFIFSASYLISHLLYISSGPEIAGTSQILYSFSLVTIIGFLFPVSFYLFIHVNTDIYMDNNNIKYIDFQHGKVIMNISKLEEVEISGEYIIINSKREDKYYLPVNKPEEVKREILVRKI